MDPILGSSSMRASSLLLHFVPRARMQSPALRRRHRCASFARSSAMTTSASRSATRPETTSSRRRASSSDEMPSSSKLASSSVAMSARSLAGSASTSSSNRFVRAFTRSIVVGDRGASHRASDLHSGPMGCSNNSRTSRSCAAASSSPSVRPISRAARKAAAEISCRSRGSAKTRGFPHRRSER